MKTRFCIAVLLIPFANVCFSQTLKEDRLQEIVNSSIIDLVAMQSEIVQSYSVCFIREHTSDGPTQNAPVIATEFGRLAKSRKHASYRFETRTTVLNADQYDQLLGKITLKNRKGYFVAGGQRSHFKEEDKFSKPHMSDPFGLTLADTGSHHGKVIDDNFVDAFFQKYTLSKVDGERDSVFGLFEHRSKKFFKLIEFKKKMNYLPCRVEGRLSSEAVKDIDIQEFRKLQFHHLTETVWKEQEGENSKGKWFPEKILVHNIMPSGLEDMWEWRFVDWQVGLETINSELFDETKLYGIDDDFYFDELESYIMKKFESM